VEIVIDANILFAIMIKSGITERILLADNLHTYAPEYIFLEFKKHRNAILRITSREESEALVPDKDDAAYLAVCIAKRMPLWSNDNHFAHQDKVKVFTTQELIKYLGIE